MRRGAPLGELTKRRLEALAGSGDVDLRADRPGQRDRYGRLLVRLIVNGEDAACILIKEGYARPWLSKLNLRPFRRVPGAAPGAS